MNNSDKILLIIATGNRGKTDEFKSFLKPFENQLKIMDLKDLNRSESPEETGTSFEENAKIKAQFFSKIYPEAYIIADDSGLEVEALNSAPGIFSSRYSGKNASDSDNIDKVLAELSTKSNNNARFRAVLALYKGSVHLKSFSGEVRGEIIRERRGSNGFGYDPVFFFPPENKTFAQIPGSVKNKISHRADALKKFRDYLVSEVL